MVVVIPVAAALILLSAFSSVSSTAIFSVGGPRIRTLLEEGFKVDAACGGITVAVQRDDIITFDEQFTVADNLVPVGN